MIACQITIEEFTDGKKKSSIQLTIELLSHQISHSCKSFFDVRLNVEK